jgi:hypothetical protein
LLQSPHVELLLHSPLHLLLPPDLPFQKLGQLDFYKA